MAHRKKASTIPALAGASLIIGAQIAGASTPGLGAGTYIGPRTTVSPYVIPVDSTKTINCTDGTVTISGIRNTVNITGHCVRVAVSGMNNNVTVDNADAIGASGFDNRVTFHSGSPQIDNAGSNVVEQG